MYQVNMVIRNITGANPILTNSMEIVFVCVCVCVCVWDTFLLLYVNLDLSCDMHVTYLVLASDYSVQVSFCHCI